MQKLLKSHLVRTQSLNLLPLKSGVGQYIAIHAALTARDFFISTHPVHLPAFFSKTSLDVFVPDVGPQNKTGHPTGRMFPC